MKIWFCAVLCVCVLALWAAALFVRIRKKHPLSLGQLLSSLGITVICIGLLLTGLESISTDAFRLTVGVGVLTELAALFFIRKHQTF